MSFWDFLKGLKGLVNFELNSPLVQVTKNTHNKSGGDNKEAEADKENNKIIIYRDNLSEEKRKELDNHLKEYVNEGNLLLEKNSRERLSDLYKYNRKGEDKKTLNFFRPIIPDYDYEALKASLYLRKKFKENEDIRELKQDIRKRFGDRGKNISNLCTAGYFEKFLIPLYNSSKDKFNELYEIIISKSVLALFVHGSMSKDDILKKISTRIQISSQYGIKFIHIHGIGKQNISVIRECLEEKKDFFSFFEKEIYENKEDGIIMVELLLN